MPGTFSLIRASLGPQRAGHLRFRVHPWTRRPWSGPFNGQRGRVLAVCELMLKVQPAAIVETGTYLGETTEWLSAFQTPVYSCEATAENFGYAKVRLRHIDNVSVSHSDSRAALKRLLTVELGALHEQPIFFYLDAHWYDDLPLADELEIVFSTCSKAVVMVDDFQVPNDDGYSFDDYGSGKALTHAYIADALRKFDLKAFYPTLPSRRETGARRGTVVLAKRSFADAALSGLTTLAVAG